MASLLAIVLGVFAVLFALPLVLLAFLVRPRPARIAIKGRHVFITGGSSGIGLALAQAAAKEGARVSILARDPSRLAAARDSIRLATGVEAAVFAADVRDATAVARAVEAAGPVDVLVCNQGLLYPLELEKQPLQEIRDMIDVNLIGTINLIKAALPAMRSKARDSGRPASIVLMSSQAGQVGIYGYSGYSASKFALRGLAEALQHEVIADNIYVSMIFPRATETPTMTAEMKRRPELTNIIAPPGNAMKPEQVAKISLDGIKSAAFAISCEGLPLCIATAGLSPQSSYLMAVMEVYTASLMRFVALLIQCNWYNTIENFRAKKKNV